MSLQVMVTGKITVGPQKKVSQNGNPYTFALVSVPTHQERLSASVFAFGEVAEVLSALDKGDEVAISGSAALSEWEQEGEKRAALTVNAEQVMSLYQMRKKRKKIQQTQESIEDDFDDSVDDI